MTPARDKSGHDESDEIYGHCAVIVASWSFADLLRSSSNTFRSSVNSMDRSMYRVMPLFEHSLLMHPAGGGQEAPRERRGSASLPAERLRERLAGTDRQESCKRLLPALSRGLRQRDCSHKSRSTETRPGVVPAVGEGVRSREAGTRLALAASGRLDTCGRGSLGTEGGVRLMGSSATLGMSASRASTSGSSVTFSSATCALSHAGLSIASS